MKIALIGDVHANLPALETVLQHARENHVEAIWNVGDSVGYGPFPDEVVLRLQQENVTSLIGNYDLKVLDFPKNRKKFKKNKRPEKFLAFQWAYEHLSSPSRQYLESLSKELWLQVLNRQILLVHASLSSNEELLTPGTPKAHLKDLAKKAAHQNPNAAGIDIIIFGHSHQPFARLVAGVWFINPGSVGRPGDGDPRTSYALLELDVHAIQVEHYRLDYDIQAAVLAVREKGLPEAFAQMLLHGVELDEALTK
jgi:putative phosphoesterase